MTREDFFSATQTGDFVYSNISTGLVNKVKNDVRWDMIRSSTGQLQQISPEKTLKITNQQERGLTLADTEGMFLLLGIGFLIAGGALVSEWVGGCTNKCMNIMKIKKEKRDEETRLEEEVEWHRVEKEEEDARIEEEDARIESEDVARMALESASSAIGITFMSCMAGVSNDDDQQPVEIKEEMEIKGEVDSSSSSRRSKHSRTSSALLEMNAATLYEMFEGPKTRPSNIICINGKVMSETDATKYASDSKRDHESEIQNALEKFDFLDDDEAVQKVCQVEINLQAPSESDDGTMQV